MRILRAFRTELDPNMRLKVLLGKHCGAARFAYNWGLDMKRTEYELTGRSPGAMELHRILIQRKREDLGWLYEVSKCAPQEALRGLDRAFRNFFQNRAHFPRFKRRKDGRGSFHLTGTIRVDPHHIQLPRLGRVRLKERGYLPTPDRTDVHILSATVSERAGRWFVSLQCEVDVPEPELAPGPPVGVDTGTTPHLATLDDGTTFDAPHSLEHRLRKVRRLQRSLSRKRPGSRNRRKARRTLARFLFHVSNNRKDALHKTTTNLVKAKPVIVVEDLDIQRMMEVGTHPGNRHLADAGLGEFYRQLEYKAKWYGRRVVKAPPYYPSTRMCSTCGAVMDGPLLLGERTFRCARCGLVLDRDVNAARNLVSLVAPSCGETVNAYQRREVAAEVQAEAVPACEVGTKGLSFRLVLNDLAPDNGSQKNFVTASPVARFTNTT